VAKNSSAYPITKIEGLNFVETSIEVPFGEEKTLKFSTGKLAKQAHGSIVAQFGNTTVLVAVVASNQESDKDFFPLLVDYREKFYAGGRIPGGFFKREARPSDNETLSARIIDRTIRPLFPEGFKREVQVYVTVLSTDSLNPAELPALAAAGAALHISEIPFLKPVAAVRIGRIDGKLIVNPNKTELLESDLDLLVAGHADAINMVECGAKEVPEEVILEALELAHNVIKGVTAGSEALRKSVGKPKIDFKAPAEDAALRAEVDKAMKPHIKEIQATHKKHERDERLNRACDEVAGSLAEKHPDREKEIKAFCHAADEREMRRTVTKKGIRADGRKTTEIRPIWIETDTLPRVHGSSVFTRGETQALAVVTLGGVKESQMIDDMTGITYKKFLLHYNFPPYSVGECRPPRGPGRREIGHGMLAERAIAAVLPPQEEFPYTVRLVIEILESNGSSSMATVCSGVLALQDAGVPLKAPVAGIAMGLITDDDGGVEILSDIAGIEDHCGDMDFKVAGSRAGITALQMDIKIEGVTKEILRKALEQAKAGREHILSKMEEAMPASRVEMKPQTPRITILKIPTDKIREVIGSGGKIIRQIVEDSGAQVDIEDDGSVFILAADKSKADAAIAMIRNIVEDLEEGSVVTGPVVRIIESGAIVQLGPGKDGMIHISELEYHRVATVTDVLKEGEIVTVKVVEVDKARGRVRLSRKALLPVPEGYVERERPERSDRGDRGDRGGRDRDRGPRRDHSDGDRGPRRDHSSDSSDPSSRRPRPPRPPRGDND
jgi:polyribonucleotide nucleotidyltransferase